jgi:hypothetical protein
MRIKLEIGESKVVYFVTGNKSVAQLKSDICTRFKVKNIRLLLDEFEILDEFKCEQVLRDGDFVCVLYENTSEKRAREDDSSARKVPRIHVDSTSDSSSESDDSSSKDKSNNSSDSSDTSESSDTSDSSEDEKPEIVINNPPLSLCTHKKKQLQQLLNVVPQHIKYKESDESSEDEYENKHPSQQVEPLRKQLNPSTQTEHQVDLNDHPNVIRTNAFLYDKTPQKKRRRRNRKRNNHKEDDYSATEDTPTHHPTTDTTDTNTPTNNPDNNQAPLQPLQTEPIFLVDVKPGMKIQYTILDMVNYQPMYVERTATVISTDPTSQNITLAQEQEKEYDEDGNVILGKFELEDSDQTRMFDWAELSNVKLIRV